MLCFVSIQCNRNTILDRIIDCSELLNAVVSVHLIVLIGVEYYMTKNHIAVVCVKRKISA